MQPPLLEAPVEVLLARLRLPFLPPLLPPPLPLRQATGGPFDDVGVGNQLASVIDLDGDPMCAFTSVVTPWRCAGAT